MGFIKEIYSDNRAGLVVSFGRNENSENYFSGDSVEEAMRYFHIYIKNNEMFTESEDSLAIGKLGIKTQEAAEFRTVVNEIIESLSDEQALATPVLFPVWQDNVNYKIGERVRYEGKLYKVLQEHNSQFGWEPFSAVSLFVPLLIDEETGEVLEWVQPSAENGYSIGDKVLFNGEIYESLIDNNVWSPEAYPAGWVKF